VVPTVTVTVTATTPPSIGQIINKLPVTISVCFLFCSLGESLEFAVETVRLRLDACIGPIAHTAHGVLWSAFLDC
jgi:hypothetical protein